jgi:hypothetical protein
MSQPPLNNPGARYWDDLVEEFDFSRTRSARSDKALIT